MDITQTFTAYCQESDTELGQDKEMFFIRDSFVFSCGLELFNCKLDGVGPVYNRPSTD